MSDIKILTDKVISSEDEIKIHFTYGDKLTLRELREILDLTNKAINDLNRENGAGNNATIGKKYATEVTRIEQGSVVLYIVANLVTPVALSILANFLYDRFKRAGSKKEGKVEDQQPKYPVSITVNADDNNGIEIHIG